MIYRFRVLLDTHEDVFRDIEIEASDSLEDLHNVIVQSFGFEGQEMASFYVSNEKWEQGEEIALFDMDDKPGDIRIMSDTRLEDTVWEKQPRLLYIYDFLKMWTFMVELAQIVEPDDGMSYPNLMFAHGQIPAEAPDREFIIEDMEEDSESEDVMDLDPDDYDSLDFDENWN
ncbi:plasmid pRiA4b ORF-3 family protein [Flavobacteriaceae bacterium TK19130]|nr:plasmid pRiA4b ORF-3 family protein [Thermobacterium salinum]